MVELLPSLPVAAILAAAGVVLALILVPYAARRTVAQPLVIAVEDEVRLLLGVLSDLRRLPYLTSLAASDFAAGANSRLWAALLAVAEPELSQMSDDPDDQECARIGAALVDRGPDFHVDLHSHIAASPNAAVDLERLSYLSELSATRTFVDSDVVDAGQAVLLTGTDRARLGGAGLVLPSSTPDSVDPAFPPIRRVLAPVTRLRRVLVAAATAASGALLYGFAVGSDLHGTALWLGVAALGVLLGGSVVIALVDLDTFYVDIRSFLVTTLAAWTLTAAAVGVAGHWDRLVAGVVVVAATAVIFEVANRIFRKLRGMDGQGLGDTLIIIATAGIPPALTGDLTLGFYSVMCGMATCVLGWVVGRARGKLDASSPVAFGPYLAAGWILGWVLYVLVK